MKFAMTIFRYFPYGGLQLDFLRTAETLLQRGHRITVFFGSWEGGRIPGAEFVRLPMRGITNWGSSLAFQKGLLAALAEDHFDCVLGFNRTRGLDFYYAADNCFAATARRRHPIARIFLPRYRVYERMERDILRRGEKNHIFCIAERQMQEFRKFYQTEPERLHLLAPGIAPEFHLYPPEEALAMRQSVRREFQLPEDAIVLIQVASSFRTKGVDRTIFALASLPDELRERCRLLVVGRERSGRFGELARRNGVEALVRFTGPRSDVLALLHGADLMIHPARNEATGGVLTEAFACEVPAIASGACGFASLVGQSGGTVLPEPFRQSNLNSALKAALASAEHLADLKRFAAEYGEKNDFHRRYEEIAEWLEELYHHVQA